MNSTYPLCIDLDQPGLTGFRQFISSWLYCGGNFNLLVDPGPLSTIPHLIAEVRRHGVERLDYILLTHIHIDHAGGTGALLKEFPEAKVICHPDGIRHLVTPAKLWEGSQKVLGPELAAAGAPGEHPVRGRDREYRHPCLSDPRSCPASLLLPAWRSALCRRGRRSPQCRAGGNPDPAGNPAPLHPGDCSRFGGAYAGSPAAKDGVCALRDGRYGSGTSGDRQKPAAALGRRGHAGRGCSRGGAGRGDVCLAAGARRALPEHRTTVRGYQGARTLLLR